MSLLSDIAWKLKYTPEDGDLLHNFYIPALACAVRYDRTTGYFRASALAAAARGVEGLILNDGGMRLIVGCTLGAAEAAAIEKGESLRGTVEACMMGMPLAAADPETVNALELLAWMVAKGFLDVKVAIRCDDRRRPVTDHAIFHEKTGIIEDKTGDRIAFNGSVNESESGWRKNFDSFHVFTSWGGAADHVDEEEKSFGKLWADRASTAMVIDVPAAVRDELLKFLPENDRLPGRLARMEQPPDRRIAPPPSAPEPEPAENRAELPAADPRKAVWTYIRNAPALPNGGERVGEATCPIVPWPHQVRAFNRMYENWPPRLLIADEVGLGKTIQAGMILRQGWLSGRAQRILVLAPKAVLSQWQIELREKFNLNWPIYDGKKFTWRPSPGLSGPASRVVERSEWHAAPFVLASSHLMRRKDRARELLEEAAPWDLIVLDEAHHARRRGGGVGSSDDRPNRLLRLMTRLKDRTKGLILLTATPMQVSPVEVWDLLNLFDLPPEWDAEAFLRFFEYASMMIPGDPEMDAMAAMFRSIEKAYGEVPIENAMKLAPRGSKLKANKILKALRDVSSIPRRKLETPERRAAVNLMKANTPIKRLISRHTRQLLRKYRSAGRLSARIAQREVADAFVEMSDAERALYKAVEDYISTTYNNAAPDKRSAIGFVMTIYRRRLASSFFALAHTLESRACAVDGKCSPADGIADRAGEDVMDDELADEIMGAEDAEEMAEQALALEERADLELLLEQVRRLPVDTKTAVLLDTLETLRAEGYRQAMVFTQFTDTLDFLREKVVRKFNPEAVVCFSGRGGEVLGSDGAWRRITRDETKRWFREGKAEIMLCTDAAAEGLNFQFCGALINYDMPWNPMKVEQRIGRIDRLGQEFETIRIVNLHYEDTVETDVYRALSERIELFTNFVGKLQPILAKLPKAISDVALGRPEDKLMAKEALVSNIAAEADKLDVSGFDLDKVTDEELIEPERPTALYGLPELGRILLSDGLLPPGVEAEKLGEKDIKYLAPGMPAPIRVTTDPEFFDAHPESVELWSPGSPLFPEDDILSGSEDVEREDFFKILAMKG